MTELERLRHRCDELEALCALMRELLQLESYEEMLDAVVRHSLAILGAERGFLVLKRGEALDFAVVRNWSRDELESREPVSRSVLKEALRGRKPLLVEDALADPRFAGRESVQLLRIRSVLAAPLQSERELLGALYLETSSVERPFGPPQLELFAQILEISSRALTACLRRIGLEQRNSLLEQDWLARFHYRGVVTRDPGFLRVLETVAKVAASELPVLVQGPSGAGKELVTRALHLNSRRQKKPFLTLNCGAISPALLESELFGHVSGAFTGATRDKAGLIAAADGGTVFLDEVGELPKELQAKLLRVLQFGEIQPVGSVRTQTVDVRFLAATNRDLELEVKEGRFREDLLFRLNAITIAVPPLRERPDDILPLFYHFLRRAAEAGGQSVPDVSPKLEQALQQYAWPGNIRELENEAGRLMAIHTSGTPLTPDRLSPRILGGAARPPDLGSLRETEKEQIEKHLRLAGGNRTHAARSLGISRETLRQRMLRYGLS